MRLQDAETERGSTSGFGDPLVREVSISSFVPYLSEYPPPEASIKAATMRPERATHLIIDTHHSHQEVSA